MRVHGVFICIEGLDGCGKTTQAKLLVKKLKQNYDAVYTTEPSKGKIGRFIRRYCLNTGRRELVLVEALLFAADRVDHMKNEVSPALKAGKIVVSDRYVYSSFAYQGAAGLAADWIERINEYAVQPDLALFIDVDPETVMKRLRRRKSVMETLSTQRKVREIYRKFVETGRLVRIDGNRSRGEVAKEVENNVKNFLRMSC